MRKEEFKKDRHHRGEHNQKTQRPGAKTFRRGRALAFLEILNVKRDTLKHQLETPELQSINQILVGELKAIDMIINEFIQVFDIHESEVSEVNDTNDGENETDSTEKEQNQTNDKNDNLS